MALARLDQLQVLSASICFDRDLSRVSFKVLTEASDVPVLDWPHVNSLEFAGRRLRTWATHHGDKECTIFEYFW